MATATDKLATTLKKFGKGWEHADTLAGLRTAYHKGWKARVWFEGDTTGTEADPPQRTMLTDVYAPSADWCKALCKFAACEKGRYALNSIEVELTADGARFTATDGKKLTSQVFGTVPKHAADIRFHVDADALAMVWDVVAKAGGRHGNVELGYAPIKQTVLKAIEDGYQTVYGQGSSRREKKYRYEDVVEDTYALVIQCKAGYNGVSCVATIDRAEGEYPAWRDVMPDTTHSMHLPSDFFKAVEVLKGTTSIESQAVLIEVRTDWADPETKVADPARMTLRSRHLHPRVDAVCELGTIDKDKKYRDITIGLDPHYLTLIWELMVAKIPAVRNCEDVVMHYKDKDTGVLLTLEVKDTYLIMPLDM